MSIKSPITSAVLAGGLVAAILASPVSWSAHETATLTEPDLTVPAGFQVERVAGPPLVDRPIVADFDDEGRLYVADSSGSNDRTEKQLADRPHRIVRLEDTNGDGVFDASVVFADRMMFPEGTMWLDGSLYVAAPPSIWKLTDTNGDGIADVREEWFQGKTLTGCANDLHGPYLGPDGWIYWTKGAFAEQTYERPGNTPLVTRASHIFRRRAGEAVVEPVMTGGMDNPVDVAFTAAGERILTATFLEHPQLGRRDALVHAVYGGVYGKPHAVIDGHKRTGDLMPVMTHLGPAVPSGLTRYVSRVFGDEYRDTFFATMFNLHKVTRHTLEPSGATFQTHDLDFLISKSRDFHPTDVLEDADGSLLVIDTGPWYKLCCPTSQLAKPEVLGAIYRVRRKAAAKLDDPRGLRLAWRAMNPLELTRLLDDVRPAVQNRALHQFGRVGAAAVPALRQVLTTSKSADARRNAVWALTRIEAGEARDAVRVALTDPDQSVRQAAVHASGLWRDTAALQQLTHALKSNVPAVQRAAAEALGRLRDSRAVPDLLAIAASPLDRVLEHSVTYALIEIADPAAAASGLESRSSQARRTALLALDQMDGGGVAADAVIPLLDSPDPVLKETAWWIGERHPEWGDSLVKFFEARLTSGDLDTAEREDLQRKLARFGQNAAVQALLAETVVRVHSSPARQTVLRAMADARVKVLPTVWAGALVHALGGRDVEVLRAAVSVVRATPAVKDAVPQLHAALLRVARNRAHPADVRVDALAAAPGGLTSVEPELFDFLRARLEPAEPAAIRSAAASVIEKAVLAREQLLVLAASLKHTGPLELPRLLRAFEHGADEALGLAVIMALEQSTSRASLRPEILRPWLVKYPESVQKRGAALLASIHVDAAEQAGRLDRLLATLQRGDVRRGQVIFNSEKAACSTCHAIGYLGGRIGPDLTRIGQVRSERDLLEAIVFPSASFARSYEPVTVATTSGATHSGMLRSDGTEEVVLATAGGDEIRIPRREIKEMHPGTVSLMPSGLEEQLTGQELADLLAFLKATRPGAD